jgi:hypothetical protein
VKQANTHTPGPWLFEKGEDRHIRASGQPGSLMCDAQYYPWVPGSDADWHLIAAAPDMLVALEDANQYLVGLKAYLATCATDVIVENLESTIAYMRNKVEMLEAVIGKAKGAL